MGFIQLCNVLYFPINLSLILMVTTATLHEFRICSIPEIRHYTERHIAEVKKLSPINMIIDTGVDPDIANIIVSEYAKLRPILIDQEDGRKQRRNYASTHIYNIVGIFQRVNDIDPTKWKTFYNSMWDPRSQIAIWIISPANSLEILDVLKTFWSLDSLNLVVLVMNQCHTPGVTGYSYDPFHLTERSTRGRVYRLSATDKFYPDKMKNLQGFPISVSMYDTMTPTLMNNLSQIVYFNNDVKMLLHLSSLLNFTIEAKGRPMSSRQYYKLPLANGDVPGASYDLLTNYSEMLFNTQVWEIASDDVDHVEPYIQLPYRISVPLLENNPYMLGIFQSLDLHTLLLLLLFSIIAIIYMRTQGIRGPVLNTFRLIIHQQFHKVGTKLSERIFAISWIVFTFLFLSIQQSRLIYDLRNRPSKMRIGTLEEFANTDLPVVTDPVQYSILNRSNDVVKLKIAQRTTTDMDFHTCLARQHAGENIACIEGTEMPLTTKTFPFMQSFLTKETVATYWRTILVKKGFPYLSKFNEVLRKLKESAILPPLKLLLKEIRGNEDVAPLRPADFEGPFKILFLGIAIASSTFVLELVFHRVKLVCCRLSYEAMYEFQWM